MSYSFNGPLAVLVTQTNITGTSSVELNGKTRSQRIGRLPSYRKSENKRWQLFIGSALRIASRNLELSRSIS